MSTQLSPIGILLEKKGIPAHVYNYCIVPCLANPWIYWRDKMDICIEMIRVRPYLRYQDFMIKMDAKSRVRTLEKENPLCLKARIAREIAECEFDIRAWNTTHIVHQLHYNGPGRNITPSSFKPLVGIDKDHIEYRMKFALYQ